MSVELNYAFFKEESGDFGFLNSFEKTKIEAESRFKRPVLCYGDFDSQKIEYYLVQEKSRLNKNALKEKVLESVQSFFTPPEWNKNKSVQKELFSKQFHEIKKEILEAKIHKEVLFSRFYEQRIQQAEIEFFIDQAQNFRGNVFGFLSSKEFVLACSPETLFELQGQKLQSRVLAGTIDSRLRVDSLLNSKKDLSEHSFAVASLMQDLSQFSKPSHSDVSLLRLEKLSHLMSIVQAEIPKKENLLHLVKAMHPTAALGVYPKKEALLKNQMARRGEARIPSFFGSPFGVFYKNSAHVYVSIRLLHYCRVENKWSFPIGCGVIKESREELEWQELELKLKQCRMFFGIENERS